MVFDQRDMLVTAAAICGVLMVAGALLLLYRGTISLDPPKEGAKETELEIAKILKLKTNVASVALFAFGFAFLFLGFTNIVSTQPAIQLTGRILGVQPGEQVSVAVCGGPWPVSVGSNGTIDYSIKPDLEQFQVQIGKIGVLPETTIPLKNKARPDDTEYGALSIDNGVARIGEIKLGSSVPAAPPTPVDHVGTGAPPQVKY
jgi:hypothetical protein